MAKTFKDLSEQLPVADFLRLQRYLADPETKTYIRVIGQVCRKSVGNGQVGVVKYEPVTGGAYEDPGEIKTSWLTDQLALAVCSEAVSLAGKRCLLFQLNKDKSDKQPNGFRELVWIQELE